MRPLLTGFAALSLISGVLLAVLDESSLRQTVTMVVGLMLLLYWMGGLQDLLQGHTLPSSAAPASVLASTGICPPTPQPTHQEAFP